MPTTEDAPWFERWPELAEWELQRFEARGLEAGIDEAARAAGRFVVRTQIRFDGQDVDLEVQFPAETPELPPQVFAETQLMDRHQHPFGGNFCLLERPLDDWPASQWGAADLIAERLEALLDDTSIGAEAVRTNEAPIPEPFTAFYDYPLGPVVLLPADIARPTGDSGSMVLRYLVEGQPRFTVEAVGSTETDEALLQLFPQAPTIRGKWIRLDTPPPAADGPGVAAWARKHWPSALRARVPRKLKASKHLTNKPLQVVAFIFGEEGPGVGETREGWLFLFVPQEGEPFLAHCQHVSAEERSRRIPELVRLKERRAVLIGLGTLGGDVAVSLARAGIGGLDLVDDDRFDVNNSVRHVLGVEWSGIPKVTAVASACRRANPYCQLDEHLITFGNTKWEGASSLSRLRHLLTEADVVVETTGSHQLQRLVARVARETAVPFVSSWLTDGYWGGECFRVLPDRSRCLVCLQTDKAEGRGLSAQAGPSAPVVVQGCSHPTVSGAGFDASELAAVTTRVVVQTILQGEGHPDADWDHVVLSYRDEAGRPAPTIETARLMPREDCEECHPAAGLTSSR